MQPEAAEPRVAPNAAPASSSRAAVVVVNYGSHALVDRNLAASLAGHEDVEAVVVDSWSGDEERDAIRRVADARGWTLVPAQDNPGFGGGVRLGVERARSGGADVVAVLNPDARIDPPGLARLLDAARADPMMLVAPRVVRPDGSSFAELQELHLTDGRVRAARARPSHLGDDDVVPWVSGAVIAISLELWDATGGFDEDYFLYWEDVDLGWRVRAAGGRLRVDDELVAIHDEGATHDVQGAGRAKSPVYYFHNVRNRLLFAAKHLDPVARRRWRRATPRIAMLVLLQGGRRQLVRPGRTILPILRGAVAGLRIPPFDPRTGGDGRRGHH